MRREIVIVGIISIFCQSWAQYNGAILPSPFYEAVYCAIDNTSEQCSSNQYTCQVVDKPSRLVQDVKDQSFLKSANHMDKYNSLKGGVHSERNAVQEKSAESLIEQSNQVSQDDKARRRRDKMYYYHLLKRVNNLP